MSNEPSVGAVDQDLSGEVELADGETVTIPRPDKVHPTLGQLAGELSVCIQQDNLKMSTAGRAGVHISAPHKNVDDPTPYATIYQELSHGLDVDDIYAELALDTVEDVRELRDILNLVLRYRGDFDGE